jgi:HSP20 family protein
MKIHVGSQDFFDQLAKSMGQMIDEVFRSSYVGFRPSKTWEPSINIYEDPAGLVICVDLAGMSREEIDVQVTPGRLTVRGTRLDPQWSKEQNPCRVHLLEIHHGPFFRAVDLPADLDLDKTQALYRNGYLWVRLLKQSACAPGADNA